MSLPTKFSSSRPGANRGEASESLSRRLGGAVTGGTTFLLLQIGFGVGLLVLLLIRNQTVLMGWTLLFIFNTTSASLAAFVFGRLFGLEEGWITSSHLEVFRYSAWAFLAAVLGAWLAWRPLRRRGVEFRVLPGRQGELLAWVNPTFIYSSLALGALASMVYPIVARVPTLGTLAAILGSWLKLGVILAAVHWQLRRGIRPLAIALLLYLPMALAYSVTSGFSPVSTDLIIPLVLVNAAFKRVGGLSFLKIAAAALVLANLMFAWMASRGEIRKGELERYSVPTRIELLLTSMRENLRWSNLDAFSTQTLLFERIDMSEILASQVAFQPAVQPYRFGGTIVDGMFALVPRFLWPNKPRVAGGSEFVARYTGMVRLEEDETSIGVPVQLEIYANGGPTWVVLGFLALTWTCARIERRIFFEAPPLKLLLPSLMVLMAFGEGIQQIMLVLASVGLGAGSLYLAAGFIEKSAPRFHERLIGSTLPSTSPGRWGGGGSVQGALQRRR